MSLPNANVYILVQQGKESNALFLIFLCHVCCHYLLAVCAHQPDILIILSFSQEIVLMREVAGPFAGGQERKAVVACFMISGARENAGACAKASQQRPDVRPATQRVECFSRAPYLQAYTI